MQITYALANVYDDSPDLDVRVTEEHRARAEEMMGCVESGDVTRLRDIFLEVGGLIGCMQGTGLQPRRCTATACVVLQQCGEVQQPGEVQGRSRAWLGLSEDCWTV